MSRLSRTAFTLIELLIVIAIVGILSLVVILVINPIELLRQSRDVTRLSDLDTLNHALNLYQGDVSINPSFGTASTTYISVVDSSATTTAGTNCAGVGLPALGTGWSYHCAASSTVRNIDGTGWVPVNFASMSFGSPLGNLPLDPTNTTSSGNYYTYTPGGSWELTAIPESRKYRKTYPSTPNQPGAIINGSDLTLSPLFSTSGLVGYWNFDEGAGSTVVDSSGNGYSGIINGGVTLGQLGKVGTAAIFDGSTGYINVSNPTAARPTNSVSLVAWVNASSLSGTRQIAGIGLGTSGSKGYGLQSNGNTIVANIGDGASNQSSVTSNTVSAGTWYQAVLTYDGSTLRLYVNGTQWSTPISLTLGYSPYTDFQIGQMNSAVNRWSGAIDDVRVYNRALSAAEISAIYNATK